MKINVKAFVISFTIVVSMPMVILFIWSALNGFGLMIVKIFESIHPSGGMSIVENINGSFTALLSGIIINSLYMMIDAFIVAFAFSKLYNFLSEKFNETRK